MFQLHINPCLSSAVSWALFLIVYCCVSYCFWPVWLVWPVTPSPHLPSLMETMMCEADLKRCLQLCMSLLLVARLQGTCPQYKKWNLCWTKEMKSVNNRDRWRYVLCSITFILYFLSIYHVIHFIFIIYIYVLYIYLFLLLLNLLYLRIVVITEQCCNLPAISGTIIFFGFNNVLFDLCSVYLR